MASTFEFYITGIALTFRLVFLFPGLLLYAPICSCTNSIVKAKDPSLPSIQDQPQISLEELLQGLGAEAPAGRLRAEEELIRRWKLWSAQDIAKIEQCTKHEDAEVKDRASRVILRIKKRFELGEDVVHVLPNLDLVLLSDNERPLLQQLEIATDLWKQGRFSDHSFEALVKCIRSRSWPKSAEAVINLTRDERAIPLIPLVVTFLRGHSSDIRERAVITLERLGVKDRLQELLACLGDESKGVRCAAIQALGELGYREAATSIVPLLEDGQETVRRAAARALAKIGTPESAKATLQFLKSDDPSLRSVSIESLPPLHEFAQPVLSFLKDPDSRVRASALYTLRRIGRNEDADAAAQLLEDPSLDVRLQAVSTIEKLGSARHAPAVRKLLHEKEPRLRAQSLLALEQLGPDEKEFLDKLDDADDQVRAAACRCLSRLPNVKFEERFLGLLGDQSNRVRNAAIDLIVTTRPKGIADMVRALLDNKNPYVRSAAIQVVGRLDLREHSRRIVDLLEDENRSVKSLAALHLRHLSIPEGASNDVIRLCQSDDSQTVCSAAFLIGAWRLSDGESVLKSLLSHKSPEVRLEAARALGRIGTPACFDPLVDLMRDPEPSVGAAGAISIAELVARHKESELKLTAERALRKAKEGNNRTLRVASSISLLKLGLENKDSQSRLVREIILTPSLEADFSNQLSDALGRLYTRDFFTRLETPVLLRGPVESLDDLSKVLESSSLKFKAPSNLTLNRRIEGGVSLSPYDLLRRAFGDSWIYLADDHEIKMMSIAEALEYWKDRLNR